MENISIVIRDTEDKIYEHVQILKPLLEDNKTQLVLINNIVEKFNLPYEYTLYEFSEDYSKFEDFYKSICLYDNILLVEKGMKFDKIIIDSIKRCVNKNTSLIVKMKKLINKNKGKYIDYDNKLLLNYKTRETEYLDASINEDLSLVDFSLQDIQVNLYKLLERKQYKTIYEWYSDCVSNCGNNYEEKFFQELENLKYSFNFTELEELNALFLTNRCNEKYKSFLIIKSLYEERKEEFEKQIKDLLCENDFDEENIYFSNFIRFLFKERDYCLKFIKYINLNALDKYIKHLLEIDRNFYLDIYNFIISIDLNKEISIDNNEKVLTIIKIIKIYVDYMGDKSADIEKKNILIQMFLDYSNYGFYTLNKLINNKSLNLEDVEVKFLIEMDKATGYMDKGLIVEAISILREAGEQYELMTMPVRYYIQKLIRDNNIYPYKLSICIMAKNEEKFLDKCLSSIKPLLDNGIAELIFVDTGSTDRTVDIANKYVDKIYHKMWEGNFSKMRNYCISLAQGEYIFIMDADYEVEKNDISKIISYFEGKEYTKYETGVVNIKNFSDEEYTSFSAMTQSLIFKNNESFYYKGSVHNQPICKKPFKFLDVTILHYGYIMTEDIKDKKFERTAKLLKKELQKDPHNLYYRMQLSTSYSMHGDHKKALEQVNLYMKSLEDEEITKGVKLMACNNAVIIYASSGLYERVIQICNRALEVEPDFIDFIYNKALAHFFLEQYNEAIAGYENYINLIENIESLSIINDERYIFYSLDSEDEALGKLLICYYRIRDFEAFDKTVKKLNNDMVLEYYVYTIVKFYIENDKYSNLRQFFVERIMRGTTYNVKYIFSYSITEIITKCSEDKKNNIIMEFDTINEDDEYLKSIKNLISSKNYGSNVLDFVNKYNLDKLDLVTAKMILDKTYPLLLNLNVNVLNIEELKALKDSALFILNRTINTKIFKGLSKNDVLTITQNYIKLCTVLINEKRYDLLKEKEIRFTEIINFIFEDLYKNDLTESVRKVREAVIVHEEMARPMQVYLETVIPGYDAGLEYFNNGEDKMNNEFIEYSKKIKSQIEGLINTGYLKEARALIEEYEKIVKEDLDIYSMKAIILIIGGRLDEAKEILLSALNIDSKNFDLNYNLAYVCEQKEEYSLAFKHYNKALEACNSQFVKEEISTILENIKIKEPNVTKQKKRIVFFDKGDDKFIWDIINELSNEYETKHIRVTNYKHIDEGMEWADICWFEWCDELIAYGSRHKLVSEKKIICRLHRYEALTYYPKDVQWENVDKLIIVTEHLKKFLIAQLPDIVMKVDIVTINNGINLDKYELKERKSGFNIAYVGYIHQRKNPFLLLQIISQLVKINNRYKLYVAGQFQDALIELYWNYQVEKMGLQNNVIFQGWQDNINRWLQDKNYILSTSIHESFGYGIAEAMTRGIKPIIHDFVFSEEIWDKKYLFNTIDEAIKMITDKKYNSKEYRRFIEERYSLSTQMEKVKELLKGMINVN